MEVAADLHWSYLHSAAEGSNFLSHLMQATYAYLETQGMEWKEICRGITNKHF